MAIRFQCAGCGEPIEIDDQWAAKPVVCPYCRKTITAPSESTLQDVSQIPTARPMPGAVQPAEFGAHFQGAGIAVPGAPSLTTAAGRSANTVALASLMLGSLAMLFFIINVIVSMGHMEELQVLQKRVEEVGQMAATSELLDETGQMPGWAIASVLVSLGAMASAFAALVCGAIGLRQVYHRGYAIAGLVTGGMIVLILCGGGMLSLALLPLAG